MLELKKKKNFIAINILFFYNDVDINNILISKRISSGEKNYKYFISYADEYKIKPFTIIFQNLAHV